jgi:acyl CoA:acetate/3-ketoacid CoA transferase
MATLNLSNGIRMNNPDATGASDSFLPNANAAYGPHGSLEVARRAVAEIYQGNIPLGVTVAVKVGSVLKEYWNPTNVTTFVEKQSAGGGGSFEIRTIDGVSEDTTTWLDSTFGSMAVGGHVIDTQTGKVYIKYEGGWVVIQGTILSDAVPTITRIANAQVLSYK